MTVKSNLTSLSSRLSCTPGANLGCHDGNGSGNQSCDSSGAAYGACVLSTCNPGYNLQGGVCIANSCNPGATTACTGTNGSGSQTCNGLGTGFGVCVLNACATGYNLSNQSCVADTCLPANQSQNCTTAYGSGMQTCNDTGSGWNACVPTSCIAGYNLQSGGICVPNQCAPGATTTCSYSNGTGTETCNAQGSGYGSCGLTACNSGYNLQNGQCVANTCNPNTATEACTSSDGTGSGTATCNSTGTGWGACVISTCISGYNLQGSNCVPNACTPGQVTNCSSENGTGTWTCNAAGTAESTCSLNACSSGYTLQNGVCVVSNSCTPSTIVNCTGSNGTGIQYCSAQGTLVGSCWLTVCDSGYNLQNGVCVVDYCSPGTAMPCTTGLGGGIKVCNTTGTAYSACIVTSPFL